MKKPRLDAPSPLASQFVTALPFAVLSEIVAYAIPEKHCRHWERQRRILNACVSRNYQPLALVSRPWLTLVTELTSLKELQSLHGFIMLRQGDLVRLLRDEVALRRSFMTKLRLETVETSGNQPTLDIGTILQTIVSLVPHLQELDLENVKLPCTELTSVVRLASRTCPAIHTLLLPKRVALEQPLLDTVFESAATWLKNNVSHSGLRCLRLPPLALCVHDVATATAFVDRIIECCPNIQVLESAAHLVTAVSEGATVVFDHYGLWQINLETWTRFCETCTRLTQVEWLYAPFATRFFEIFAQHIKYQLTKLTVAVMRQWNWDFYLSDVDAGTRETLKTTGYGESATNLHVILRACPALRELTIRSDTSEGTAPLDGILYGDTFWLALAAQCPSLSSLVVCHGRLRAPPYRQSGLLQLSVCAMRAIATLSWLTFVHLEGVVITGDGLFDLVVHHTAATTAPRVYKIELRKLAATGDKVFYNAVDGFVQRLAGYEPGIGLPCASRRVVLRLSSEREAVDRDWSRWYFSQIRRLVAQAKASLPTIVVRGLVNDYDSEDESFGSMYLFTFATTPLALDEEDDESSDDGEAMRIDAEFLSRECRGLPHQQQQQQPRQVVSNMLRYSDSSDSEY